MYDLLIARNKKIKQFVPMDIRDTFIILADTGNTECPSRSKVKLIPGSPVVPKSTRYYNKVFQRKMSLVPLNFYLFPALL